MIGISTEIEQKYSQEELARLFSPKAYQGEIRVRYRRPNGDLTSPLPSSRHMQYVAKGWVAAEVYEDPSGPAPEPIELPKAVQIAADNDLAVVWRRGDAEISSSGRNALSLMSKGWEFVKIEDEQRLRDVAEARVPPADRAPAARRR